jgi:AraC-like DNA-binding protein
MHHQMKRFTVPVFLLLIILLGQCSGYANEKPRAVNGVLDLSGWDFKNNGSFLLDVDWEFYPMRRLSPDDFKNPGNYNREFIQFSVKGLIDHGWNYFDLEYNRGFSTYRLKVTTGKSAHGKGTSGDSVSRSDPGLQNNLGLLIYTVRPPYKLFINGVLTHENGRPAADSRASVSGYSSSIIPLSSPDNVFDIILQADNFSFPEGGINYNIRVDSLASLQESLQKYDFLSVFFLIVIFILGLNQLILFAFQRSERQYLFFGLCCFGYLLFCIGCHHNYWSTVLPSFPWDSFARIMESAIYAGDLFFLFYFQRLFPLDISKRFLYVMGFSYCIFGLGAAFLPGKSFAYIIPAYHAHALVTAIIFIYMIIRIAVKRRENSMFILSGVLAVILLGVVMINLYSFQIIEGNIDAFSLSTVIFALIQTISTMRNFIRVQRHSVQVSADYAKLKAIIDKKIASAHVISNNTESKINSAIAFLAENYREDISRENLAAALDLHPDNFSRFFKRYTGKKYGEYLNDLRINEAIRLLRETDQQVIAIAMNTGFRCLRTFNHAFINTTGRKPSDYRKQ